ncbi:MAG: hypothetical protein FJ119_13890 [Deltaproteobacteria bacterium]|nr:hypothetical protein [Deltaproteobacteria bacterium]
MHFIITGRDGSDAGALERRMKVREAHMRGIDELVHKKSLLYAAAMLNEAGAMIGSVMIVDFESREALDLYLATEPYVTGNVWEHIDVTPCKIPPVFLN